MRATLTTAIATALLAIGAPTAAAADRSPGSCADQSVDPMGCPIQTITSSGGIKVGDQNYPKQGDWVRLVVLDAANKQLTPVEGGDRFFDAARADALTTALAAFSPDDLVILTGQGISYQGEDGSNFSAAQRTALEAAFKTLGGTLDTNGPTYEGVDSLDSGQWSLIGHTGATEGFSHQNLNIQQPGIPGFLGGSPGGDGGLTGYLQIVKTSSFQFVSPEYVPIDTSAPGSTATQNVITVNGTPYRSIDLSSPGLSMSEGIQLLELDPHTGTPLVNATYFARDSEGNVTPGYLSGLQQELGGYSRRPSTVPPIVVVQSFGKLDNTGHDTIGDAQNANTRWVDDTLPPSYLGSKDDGQFYGWCGTGEWKDGHATGALNGHPCDPFPNHPTELGQPCVTDAHCSITQAFGELAGMPARNEVANLGIDEPEGLSFIGSARPYSTDQNELHAGADGKRTVAVLRRSRQAQWEAVGSSPGTLDASSTNRFDPSDMWRVVFGTPHEAWPLSGPPGSSLANASDYIVDQLFPAGDYSDVRQAYVPQISVPWDTLRGNMRNAMPYPRRMRARFSRADFDQLKVQLYKEMGDIVEVKTAIANYKSVFEANQNDEYVKFSEILNGTDGVPGILSQVFKDHEDELEHQEVTVHEGPGVGSSLYFAGDAVEFFAPEAGLPLGLFAGAYDFFSELYSSSKENGSATQPFNEPQQITDRASEIGADLDSRYAGIQSTLEHLEVVFVSDWGRLQAAAAQTTKNWSLDDDSPGKKLLVQSLATAGESALYKALMPIAYDQWVISPWWTDTGDVDDGHDNEGFTKHYGCKTGNVSGDTGQLEPFSAFPDSAIGLVRWQGHIHEPNQYRNNFTGRVLISKAEPMQLEDSGNSTGSIGFPGVGRAGTPPDKAVTDKLFAEPSLATQPNDPDALGLSQAAFLGLPGWTTPRLQCNIPYNP